MKRKDVEEWMKSRKRSTLGIVYKKGDPLGIYCELRGGILYDYTGHRVNRTVDIWGYVEYEKGMPIQYPFEVEK